MSHTEIKTLFNYLENNREHLSRIQNDFVTEVRNKYKWTGIITARQIESLLDIQSTVPAAATIE
jgi:hypothetical protein